MQKRKHPPRNNEFYKKYLKRKNQRVYRQWMDGKFPNLQQALIAAEIKRKPTPLDLMLRGWRKATEEQKRAFQDFIASQLEADDLLRDLDMKPC